MQGCNNKVVISYVMCITIGACLVAVVIPIGTLVLSSVESTSRESGPNLVAIFLKCSSVANVKLASGCFFLRLFLVRLAFTGTVFTCLFSSIVSCYLGSSLRYKADLLSS